MQGVLRCAEGHAVTRVLPSGAPGERDVRALGGPRVVLGELGLVGVLREVSCWKMLEGPLISFWPA